MMQKKIHIVHRNLGGVGEITHRLEYLGDERIELSKLKFQDILKVIINRHLDFHQPLSHLGAIFAFPIIFLLGKKIRIILHEAANYDESIRKKTKKKLRQVVISTCNRLGYEILAVSKYISKSYEADYPLINYTYLFNNDLEKINLLKFTEKCNTLVWMRPGDAEQAFIDINLINEISHPGKITILGDKVEFNKLITKFTYEKRHCHNFEIEFSPRISQISLLHKLASIKWFITPYPHEGFGLTAFQAMYLGAILILPKTGAIKEWINPNNLSMIEDFRQKKYWALDALAEVSATNTNTAKEIINKSNDQLSN